MSECGESERAAAYAIAFSGGGEGTRENGGGVCFVVLQWLLRPFFFLRCWAAEALEPVFFNRPVMLCTKFDGLAFLQKKNYKL